MKKWFKLLIEAILLIGLLVSLLMQDKLMAIFFILAMILSVLEEIRDIANRDMILLRINNEIQHKST